MDFSKIPKTQSASNEVQTLTVKTSETFQLSVGNVYTGNVTAGEIERSNDSN